MSNLMPQNVHTLDRVARVVLGLALLGVLGTTLAGITPQLAPWAWGGLLGFVLLGTAAMGTCPIYTVLGVSTCPVKTDA